jgi:hypothetical protein
MLTRPYARVRPARDSSAFYWLTRTDSAGVDRVIDRGEGHGARLRIERFLRGMAMNRLDLDARLAARALYTGWELRP